MFNYIAFFYCVVENLVSLIATIPVCTSKTFNVVYGDKPYTYTVLHNDNGDIDVVLSDNLEDGYSDFWWECASNHSTINLKRIANMVQYHINTLCNKEIVA